MSHPEPRHPREIQWTLSDFVGSADLHPLMAGLMLELPWHAPDYQATNEALLRGGHRPAWSEDRRDDWLRGLVAAIDLLYEVVPRNPDDPPLPLMEAWRTHPREYGLPALDRPAPKQITSGTDTDATDAAWRRIRDDLQKRLDRRDELIAALRDDVARAIASMESLRDENARLTHEVGELRAALAEREERHEDDQPGDDTHAADETMSESAPVQTPGSSPGRPEPASTQPDAAPSTAAAGEDRGASPPQAGQRKAGPGRAPGFGWSVTHQELDALPQTGTLSHAQLQAVRLRADGLLPAEIADRMSLPNRQAAQKLLGKAKEKLSAPMPDQQATTTAPPSIEAGQLVDCPYCNAKRTQRHVDQHALENQREHERQESERAKVAHLARPAGVGGAA